jgi:hypothetical protein
VRYCDPLAKLKGGTLVDFWEKGGRILVDLWGKRVYSLVDPWEKGGGRTPW